MSTAINSWCVRTGCNFWHPGWASECQDVKYYKWRLNQVWYMMLYSCTHMATVGVKGLRQKPSHRASKRRVESNNEQQGESTVRRQNFHTRRFASSSLILQRELEKKDHPEDNTSTCIVVRFCGQLYSSSLCFSYAYRYGHKKLQTLVHIFTNILTDFPLHRQILRKICN